MPVEALCPTCGAVFRLKEDYAGKKVRCNKCEHLFTVGGEKLNGGGDVGAVPAGPADIVPEGSAEDNHDDDRGTQAAVAQALQEIDEENSPASEGRAGSKPPKRLRPDEGGDGVPDDRRKVAIIMVAVVTALTIVCSGGIYAVVRVFRSASNELDALEAERNAGKPTAVEVGQLPDFERKPKDLPEALSYLKSKNVGDRRGAANWLAKQTVNDARQKDVAQALEALLKEEDATCAAAARALKVWGTLENGPALTAALKSKPDSGIIGDAPKELMAAIDHVKHEPGAPEVARFLPNRAVGEDAQRALADLGPGAGKAVLKYMNHPDEGARDRARRLLRDYKTQPAASLDRAAEDLGAADPERARAAAEWLAGAASDDALALAKQEPGRRTAVGVALNRLVDSPPTSSEETVLAAVKRWGTKDNVPALINLLTTKPYKRQAADALIAIGPACEPDVKKLLGDRDPAIASQSKRILIGIGSPDAKFVAAIEDLNSNDFGRIVQGARALQALPVDEKQRADVVAALLGTIKDTGTGGRGDPVLEDVAKALAVWTGKEDGLQVVEKVKEMHPFFCRKSRKVLIEWTGKRKVEQAIPFLVASLADEGTAEDAGSALAAMGPALGEKIEVEVLKAIEPLKMQDNDRIYLLECIKALGAVGTKKVSVPRLKGQQADAKKMKDDVMAKACGDAIAAINSR